MLRLLLPFIIAGLGAPQIAAAQEMRELVPMVFFVAKGKADSCGTGCDTWIAAHGNFDLGSARRFAVFLKKLGKRDLPIIFHSGGGSTIQAMAIGKLIRARKMAVNVGYTVPLDCGGYATSDKCKRDVNSGR